MSQMTEIRIGSNDVVLKDNIVKSSIIPSGSRELNRNVLIQGNVQVEGAVYADKLEISEGDVKFCKSVFAEKEVYILSTMAGTVRFAEACASSNKISALVLNGRVVFGADINAPKVALKNCFVAGSIFGEDVSLDNVVVLGGVFASKNLTITNSMVGLFNASQVSATGLNYMLYPTSFSVAPINQLPGTTFSNLALADLGAHFKGENPAPNTGRIVMNLQEDCQRMDLVDENDARYVVNSYSVAARVVVADLINFDKLENHFLITAASLGQQLIKTFHLVKNDGQSSDPLDLDHIVPFFFDVLTGKIEIPMLDARVSFEELKKNVIKD
ncbi:MAG: hypothetical protein Q4E52_08160 [Fibrobacter sp.]|nr:hypothetical protein [Fibrobacter sp.]